ncbi:Maltokinase OS=Streptomyces tendae OX=1932 GN=GUR47_13675 PE=3 SV=1 [Streptomyces tendae]
MSEAVIRTDTSPPGLLASLDPLLREWLPRQRWFAGKGRPVTGFSLVAATELLPADSRLGLHHVLVRAHQRHTAAGGAAEEPGDCYQLLIGTREALPPRLAPALIGHVTEGPAAGRTAYDALYDTRPAEALLEALRTRARVGGLRFERAPGQDIRTGLVPRPDDRRAVELVGRVRRYVHPQAAAADRARRQSRPGAAAGPGPRGLPPGAGTGGMGMVADLAGRSWVLGVLQPYLQGAADGLGAGAARAGQGRGLRHRGPGARAGHRRGAHGAGPLRCRPSPSATPRRGSSPTA